MKILLLNPNNEGSVRASQLGGENLGIGILAAFLESKAYTVDIIDARMEELSIGQAVERCASHRPAWIGISVMAYESCSWIRRFIKDIRAHECRAPVVLGGYFPTLQPGRALKETNAEYVILGEGEHSFLNLIRSRNTTNSIKGVLCKNSAFTRLESRSTLIADLSSLPFPRRYGLSNTTEALIEGSRGCNGNCVFCTIGPFFNSKVGTIKWRARKPWHIVREMESILDTYPHINFFRFVDANFLCGKNDSELAARIFKFSQLIKERIGSIDFAIEARADQLNNAGLLQSLQVAGLKSVFVGIESFSQRVLDKLQKGYRVETNVRAIEILGRLGINYQFGFMMFTPDTTIEEITTNIEYLKKVKTVQLNHLFHSLNIIPGTPAEKWTNELPAIRKAQNYGYLSYGISDKKVQLLIKLIGVIETENEDFILEAWLLYKEIQTHLEQGEAEYETLSCQYSNFCIELFMTLVEMACSVEEFNDLCIGGFLEEHKLKMKTMRNALPHQISFRRRQKQPNLTPLP